METEKVYTQCGECGGTGIIDVSNKQVCPCNQDRTEPIGTGTICARCNGSGKGYLEYLPFTGRKEKPGIKQVITWSGFAEDEHRHTMEYNDFLTKKL